MSPRCPICKSSKLMSLYEKYFCETCEVYLSLSLEPCALPIPNTLSHADLCDSCAKLPVATIKCRHFKDYTKRHIFCKHCKKRLHEYFQYHFYKYFSLYRIEKRVCGRFRAILLVLCFCASFRYRYLRWPVLFSKELMCGISYMSLWKLAVMLLDRSLFFYVTLTATMFECFRKKNEIYEVPTRFDDFDIQEYISRLQISKENKKKVSSSTLCRRYVSFVSKPRNEGRTHNSYLEKKIRNLKI